MFQIKHCQDMTGKESNVTVDQILYWRAGNKNGIKGIYETSDKTWNTNYRLENGVHVTH